MQAILDRINQIVWGAPTLFLILGVGIYLTVRTKFAQFRLLPKAMKTLAQSIAKKNQTEGVSGFRALCTALAATGRI